MASLNDVRQICAKLPGAVEGTQGFGFGVEVKGKNKGFIWTWKERIDPKKPRVENLKVLAVLVPSLAAKEVLLRSNPEALFTEPHYNGFPAVLVRLEKIKNKDLEDLVIEAWKCKAPKSVIKEFESS